MARTQASELEPGMAHGHDAQASQCGAYSSDHHRHDSHLLTVLALSSMLTWGVITHAGTNDVIDPTTIEGPADGALVDAPAVPSQPNDPPTLDPAGAGDDGSHPDLQLADPDELMVTVSEPSSLAIPEFVDNIVGRTLGRKLRGGLARIKFANLEMEIDQADDRVTNVTFMPTGQIKANGRFAGNAIRGEAVLRKIEGEDDELDAFPNGSFQLRRDLTRTLDVRLFSYKSKSRLTSGLQFDIGHAHPASVGYARSWHFRPYRTAYTEGACHLSYQAGEHFRFQPAFYHRDYETGASARWVDWTFVLQLDQLRGPFRVTWRQLRSRDVYVFNHALAAGRGLYFSWLLRRTLERTSGGSEQTVALGTEFRRGGTTLFRLTWGRDQSTAHDRLQFDMSQIWRMGPFDLGGLRFACQELREGVWETRLSGTFVVPITFEHSTEGGIRQRWGH